MSAAQVIPPLIFCRESAIAHHHPEPARGSGRRQRQASRSARNRRRHLRTVSAATRNSRATATIGGISGPAHASTIRARRASAWADDARHVHRSNTARSPSDSATVPASGPDEELTHQQQKSHSQSLFGPDGLAGVGVAGAPAAGKLGHQQQAAAAFVIGAGPAQVGGGVAGVGDLADEVAVVNQP